MPTLIFLLGALLSAGSSPALAPTPPVTWVSDLSSALEQAQASGTPVLAVFSGSDWGKPCRMRKQQVFDQPDFAQFAQAKIGLVRFDFLRNQRNRLPTAQPKRNEEAVAPENGRQPSLHPARRWHAPVRSHQKYWAFGAASLPAPASALSLGPRPRPVKGLVMTNFTKYLDIK